MNELDFYSTERRLQRNLDSGMLSPLQVADKARDYHRGGFREERRLCLAHLARLYEVGGLEQHPEMREALEIVSGSVYGGALKDVFKRSHQDALTWGGSATSPIWRIGGGTWRTPSLHLKALWRWDFAVSVDRKPVPLFKPRAPEHRAWYYRRALEEVFSAHATHVAMWSKTEDRRREALEETEALKARLTLDGKQPIPYGKGHTVYLGLRKIILKALGLEYQYDAREHPRNKDHKASLIQTTLSVYLRGIFYNDPKAPAVLSSGSTEANE